MHFLIFLPVMQPAKGVSFPSYMVGAGVVVLAFGPVVSPCFQSICKCSKPMKGVHIECHDIFLKVFPIPCEAGQIISICADLCIYFPTDGPCLYVKEAR